MTQKYRGQSGYVDLRLTQLNAPKKNRRMGLKGELTAEEHRLVKQAKGGPSTASEVARTMNVPTALISGVWRLQEAQEGPEGEGDNPDTP